MGPDTLETTQKCGSCKKQLPFHMFYKSRSKKTGYGYRCKECDDVARKKWAVNNPERSKISARGRNLKIKYGITLEEYQTILDSQGGLCRICGCSSDSPRVLGSFAVDHDHTTGAIRGLLCNQCNRAIGMLDDSPTLLRKAAGYLEKSA